MPDRGRTSSRCPSGRPPTTTSSGLFAEHPGAQRRDIEAANVVVRQQHHPRWRQKYVVALFERTRQRKGHAVAVGAVARYLAEATYWVLKKGEPYREPVPRRPVGSRSAASLKQGQVRA